MLACMQALRDVVRNMIDQLGYHEGGGGMLCQVRRRYTPLQDLTSSGSMHGGRAGHVTLLFQLSISPIGESPQVLLFRSPI